jgi:putative transcription antitermination factor YqgF
MSIILAFDVGEKRTGVAVADTTDGIVVSLATLSHKDEEMCAHQILDLLSAKGATHAVLGLPLLPSGQEGKQCGLVRRLGGIVEKAGISVEFLDERYTTTREQNLDTDAAAACELLQNYLSRSHF